MLLPVRPRETDSSKRLKELVEAERKTAGARPTKESMEELQECELVFSEF